MRSFSTGDQGPSALGGLAALRDLQSGLTVRQSSKRSLWTLPLTISEDLVIGVKGCVPFRLPAIFLSEQHRA